MKNQIKSLQGLQHSINEQTIPRSKWLVADTQCRRGSGQLFRQKKSDRRPDIRTLHLHDKTTRSSRRSTDVNWRQCVAWRTVIVARISIFFKFLLIENLNISDRKTGNEWRLVKWIQIRPLKEQNISTSLLTPGQQVRHLFKRAIITRPDYRRFFQKIGGRTGHVSLKGQVIIVKCLWTEWKL